MLSRTTRLTLAMLTGVLLAYGCGGGGDVTAPPPAPAPAPPAPPAPPAAVGTVAATPSLTFTPASITSTRATR